MRQTHLGQPVVDAVVRTPRPEGGPHAMHRSRPCDALAHAPHRMAADGEDAATGPPVRPDFFKEGDRPGTGGS
jgi:hypothetical protein